MPDLSTGCVEQNVEVEETRHHEEQTCDLEVGNVLSKIAVHDFHVIITDSHEEEKPISRHPWPACMCYSTYVRDVVIPNNQRELRKSARGTRWECECVLFFYWRRNHRSCTLWLDTINTHLHFLLIQCVLFIVLIGENMI